MSTAASSRSTRILRATWARHPRQAIGKTDFDFFKRDLAEKFFADEQALIKSGKAILELEEPGFDKVTGEEAHGRHFEGAAARRKRHGHRHHRHRVRHHRAQARRAAPAQPANGWNRSAGSRPASRTRSTHRSSISTTASRSFAKPCRTCSRTTRSCRPSCRASDVDEDIEELGVDLPPALDRVVDGLGRIAEIVRSMKEFSHVDQREMSQVDLNRAINSTLVIARSEYKYVADVDDGVWRVAARDLSRRPDQSGGAEPRRERGSRDRRPGEGHALTRASSPCARTSENGHAVDHDRGHRRWHSRGHSETDLRALLHDQGSRAVEPDRDSPSRTVS